MTKVANVKVSEELKMATLPTATLTSSQECLVIETLKVLQVSVSDLLAIVQEFINPNVSRFVLNELLDNRMEGEWPKMKVAHFYEPGEIVIDVKELPAISGSDNGNYLFLARDVFTNWLYISLKSSSTHTALKVFINELYSNAPFRLQRIHIASGAYWDARLIIKPDTHQKNKAFDSLFSKLAAIHSTYALGQDESNNFEGDLLDLFSAKYFFHEMTLQQFLGQCIWVYNHLLPQNGLSNRTPVQVINASRKRSPYLFYGALNEMPKGRVFAQDKNNIRLDHICQSLCYDELYDWRSKKYSEISVVNNKTSGQFMFELESFLHRLANTDEFDPDFSTTYSSQVNIVDDYSSCDIFVLSAKGLDLRDPHQVRSVYAETYFVYWLQFWSINETDIDPDELRRFKREYDVKQIINFLSGLSKRLKSVDVMKMRSERARRVNDSYQTLERKIKEVFNRVDKLLVAHMRFYYTDKVVGERSHQKVKSDWHIFLQGKDPLSPVCSAIGYFWKLEWSNEFGWYYQYTLFLDGEKWSDLDQVMDEVGKYWQDLTVCSGSWLGYKSNVNESEYFASGLVSNENAKDKRLRLRGLLGSLHRVMIKDYYSKPRLPPKTKTHYFGGAIREMLKTTGEEKRKALVLASEEVKIIEEEVPSVVSSVEVQTPKVQPLPWHHNIRVATSGRGHLSRLPVKRRKKRRRKIQREEVCPFTNEKGIAFWKKIQFMRNLRKPRRKPRKVPLS